MAKVDKKPFKVRFSAAPDAVASLKKRTELKMARSTSFCRGFYMPKAVSTWSCKGTAPRTQTCALTYKCKPTTKNFNRSSETKRLRRELRNMKVSNDSLKIKVSRKPYKKLSRGGKKLVSRLRKAKANTKSVRKPSPKIKAPKPVVSESNLNDELDELSKFNENDKVDEALVKSGVDKALSEDLEDELDEEIDSLKEETEESDSSNDEFASSSDEDSSSEDSPYSDSSEVKLAAFSFELIQVADDFDSIVTMGASWTPRKEFNSKIGMRGQFGLKTLKILSGTALEETFLVYDLGLYLNLNFTDNLFAEVGYFLEKWNNEAGDSHSAFSFGFGYKFTNKFLKVFDRVFIDYSTLSNETSNRELKFATGISF
ncbi:MAG: hypothetical protein ACJAYQ_002440 [Bacteriovoracaceae bacterium]|jgi:hypothetical protein